MEAGRPGQVKPDGPAVCTVVAACELYVSYRLIAGFFFVFLFQSEFVNLWDLKN